MSHDPDELERNVKHLRALAAELVEILFGDELRALEAKAATLLPGSEWKIEADQAELLDRLDRLERRIRLELETRVRPDGTVDYIAVHIAVLEWAIEELSSDDPDLDPVAGD